LAKWTINMVEKKGVGIFNATGIDKELTMSSLLHAIKRGVGSEAEFTWADDDFLLENEAGPWMELPLWIPEEKPLADGKNMSGMLAMNTDRAHAQGLTFRPVEETAIDTLNWYQKNDSGQMMKAGMSKEKERLLLEKWLSKFGVEEK
jgi:2'-hydroxyisoflavone reductase